MQEYPVRASHRAHLTPEELGRIASDCFGGSGRDGESVTAAFGALVALKVRAQGKALAVEVTMDPKVSAEVAAETVRRYNRFLEAATGFTSKERAKRLRKSASGGA